MKSIVTKLLLALAVVPTLAVGATVAVGETTYAASCNTTGKVSGIQQGTNCAKSDDQEGNLRSVLETVTNVLLFIIGAVAVIMIIIGGIKYVVSNGDSAQITSAKNTILYAVVGIIVALLAYAIVNFVITSFVD